MNRCSIVKIPYIRAIVVISQNNVTNKYTVSPAPIETDFSCEFHASQASDNTHRETGSNLQSLATDNRCYAVIKSRIHAWLIYVIFVKILVDLSWRGWGVGKIKGEGKKNRQKFGLNCFYSFALPPPPFFCSIRERFENNGGENRTRYEKESKLSKFSRYVTFKLFIIVYNT